MPRPRRPPPRRPLSCRILEPPETGRRRGRAGLAVVAIPRNTAHAPNGGAGLRLTGPGGENTPRNHCAARSCKGPAWTEDSRFQPRIDAEERIEPNAIPDAYRGITIREHSHSEIVGSLPEGNLIAQAGMPEQTPGSTTPTPPVRVTDPPAPNVLAPSARRHANRRTDAGAARNRSKPTSAADTGFRSCPPVTRKPFPYPSLRSPLHAITHSSSQRHDADQRPGEPQICVCAKARDHGILNAHANRLMDKIKRIRDGTQYCQRFPFQDWQPARAGESE